MQRPCELHLAFNAEKLPANHFGRVGDDAELLAVRDQQQGVAVEVRDVDHHVSARADFHMLAED
eukprot:13880347-Heterocapsa_arctica.AAC.1